MFQCVDSTQWHCQDIWLWYKSRVDWQQYQDVICRHCSMDGSGSHSQWTLLRESRRLVSLIRSVHLAAQNLFQTNLQHKMSEVWLKVIQQTKQICWNLVKNCVKTSQSKTRIFYQISARTVSAVYWAMIGEQCSQVCLCSSANFHFLTDFLGFHDFSCTCELNWCWVMMSVCGCV